MGSDNSSHAMLLSKRISPYKANPHSLLGVINTLKHMVDGRKAPGLEILNSPQGKRVSNS